MGLAILDPIITLHGAIDRSIKKETLFARTDIRWDDQPIVWVVCLGMGTSVESARMFNLFPQEGTSYVYTLPDTLVNSDPYQTRAVHQECRKRILSDLHALSATIRVSVISISAGNALGFYVANHYPVERFIAAVTGAGLGKELFWSLACIPIARKARMLGYKTGEQYDRPLRGHLPIDNTNNLPAKTHFYLGLADAQIPFWFGLKIYLKVRRHNPQAKLSVFMLGHVGVMYMLGQFFRTRIEPTVYGNGGWRHHMQRWLAYTAVRVPFRDAPMLLGGLVLGFDRLNSLLYKLDKGPLPADSKK